MPSNEFQPILLQSDGLLLNSLNEVGNFCHEVHRIRSNFLMKFECDAIAALLLLGAHIKLASILELVRVLLDAEYDNV